MVEYFGLKLDGYFFTGGHFAVLRLLSSVRAGICVVARRSHSSMRDAHARLLTPLCCAAVLPLQPLHVTLAEQLRYAWPPWMLLQSTAGCRATAPATPARPSLWATSPAPR